MALPPVVEVQLLGLVQEAMTNVRKHAGARRCPARIDEARGAVQKAEAALERSKAAARATARGPLTKAKETLAHAEAEHKGAGGDAKKHAEAVRETRTAQGSAEAARLIAERLSHQQTSPGDRRRRRSGVAGGHDRSGGLCGEPTRHHGLAGAAVATEDRGAYRRAGPMVG